MVASNTLVLNLPLENVVTDVSKSPVSPTGSNMSYQAGKIGRGNLFNGSSTQISVPDASKLRLTSEITVCAWVKKGASNMFGWLLAKRVDGSNSINYSTLIGDATDVRILQYFTTTNVNTAWVPTSQSTVYNTLNDGSWHHIAYSFVYGTGSSFKFYLDGVSTSGSWVIGNGNVGPLTSTDELYVGRQKAAGSPGYANYNIDEVHVYNKALGPSDIKRDMLGLPPLSG